MTHPRPLLSEPERHPAPEVDALRGIAPVIAVILVQQVVQTGIDTDTPEEVVGGSGIEVADGVDAFALAMKDKYTEDKC